MQHAMSHLPDPNVKFPLKGHSITYIKPTLTRPNIIVGDFSYFSDDDFEKHVTHHYDFFDDELIGLLQKLKWWDLPIEQIKTIIPLLNDSDLNRVKSAIKAQSYDCGSDTGIPAKWGFSLRKSRGRKPSDELWLCHWQITDVPVPRA